MEFENNSQKSNQVEESDNWFGRLLIIKIRYGNGFDALGRQ